MINQAKGIPWQKLISTNYSSLYITFKDGEKHIHSIKRITDVVFINILLYVLVIGKRKYFSKIIWGGHTCALYMPISAD